MDEDQLNSILDRQRVLFNHDLAGFFGEINRRFDEVEKKLETKADKKDVDRLFNSIDGVAKRIDIDEAERAAIIGQLDRHNQWIGQLAKATGIKLVPKHQN